MPTTLEFESTLTEVPGEVHPAVRYHGLSKLIVSAWVNNEDTRRAYESSDDTYRVFRKMLENGHPPDDCNQLLAVARPEGQRLQRFAAAINP